MKAARRQRTQPNRRGFIGLIGVGALVVVLGVTAVAIDQLWLGHAAAELRASADAACLAAARSLVTDDTLREEVDWEPIIERAMETAQRVARRNKVAGRELVLRPGPEGDVWFGRNVLNRETGQERFVFTDYAPTTVVVRAERTRDTGDPVTMLLGGLFGVHEANLSTMAEATIDNHVVGVRASRSLPVPALPFALLAGPRDSDDEEADDEEADEEQADETIDNWADAIDARRGRDEYGWDAERREVVREPDGLPEIVVRPMSRDRQPDEANVQLLDFGSRFRFDDLRRQCEHGLTEQDLEFHGGELRFDGPPLDVPCSANVERPVADAIEDLVGEPRLCFLYADHESHGHVGDGTLKLVRLVGVRVLDVRRTGGELEIVLQPTVVATRTALVDEDWRWRDDENRDRNPYVHRIDLTTNH